MSVSPYLTEFKLREFHEKKLMAEALDMTGYEPFVDPKTGNSMPDWLIKHCQPGSYGHELQEKFAHIFEIKDCRGRFYIQEPGYTVGFHKDRGTLCSFNFILQGSDDHISFVGRTMAYKTALLNTQAPHAVMAPRVRRVLFKISVFDKTYLQIANVLSIKLPGG